MVSGLEFLGNVNIGGFTHGVTTFFYWLLILSSLALGVYFVWWTLQYSKVKYVVRRIADNRVIVIQDKARIIKKKGQPIRWKLKKLKDYVPVPPDRAIEVMKNGKYFVEAYYTEDGEYIYIEDKFKENDVIGSLHPVKNTDKEFYIQQQEAAKKYEIKKWSDILMQLAAPITILLILIIFMMFFDRVVAPLGELSSALTGAAIELKEAVMLLQTCVENVPIPN